MDRQSRWPLAAYRKRQVRRWAVRQSSQVWRLHRLAGSDTGAPAADAFAGGAANGNQSRTQIQITGASGQPSVGGAWLVEQGSPGMVCNPGRAGFGWTAARERAHRGAVCYLARNAVK